MLTRAMPSRTASQASIMARTTTSPNRSNSGNCSPVSALCFAARVNSALQNCRCGPCLEYRGAKRLPGWSKCDANGKRICAPGIPGTKHWPRRGPRRNREHVWDETFDPFSNLIEVYVNRVRRKIDAESSSPCFTPAAALAISLVLLKDSGISEAGDESSVPRHRSRTASPLRRTMLDSVRVRLTLWYTAVLALVLVVLALLTYFIFWRKHRPAHRCEYF